MQVKIGNKIFDSDEEPILLILSEDTKENIAAMDSSATRYCEYPEGWDADAILEWMNESALDA